MINTQNHEEKHMPFADKPVIWTPNFLAGYRAYVYGGREYIYVKRRHIVKSWGGIEPFDYLTDQEKDDWYAGIAYGRKERKECRKL